MIRTTITSLVAMVMVIGTAFAASVQGPFTMSASVSQVLELNASIFEGDVVDNLPATAFNYGTLIDKGDGTLGASKHFSVLLGANSSSRAYAIRQTAGTLTFGTNTLPTGAQTVIPNNNGVSLPGTLGSQGTWVGVNKVLYTSEAAGSSQVIGAVYALGGDVPAAATAIIPTAQTGGNYAGSVTFTLVLT